MNARTTLRFSAFLSLLACSCASAPTPPRDAGTDIPAKDVPIRDVPDVFDAPQDVSPPLDRGAPDIPPRDSGPPPCMNDGDCRESPDGRVCDTATGRCVRCLAANDSCPADQHCDDATRTCVPGCRADEGCSRTMYPDGGIGPELHCNTATRACEQCVTDTHCPAGTLCVGSVCVPGCNAARACPAGETCCEGACVDTRLNVAHCGACMRACAVDHGDPVCAAGTCAIERCAAPYADCDRMTANGCETHTLTDANHCGACGRACAARPSATVTCMAGECAYRCAAGRGDCDGDTANGCETDLQSDTSHCGACVSACSEAGGSASCVAGGCVITGCDEGHGDCDRVATNGCEANLAASPAHCGACGNVCPTPAGGVAACNTGVCAFGRCAEGFADCDFNLTNGCEVNTRTDARHCGRCGGACVAPQVCMSGACVRP